MSHNEICPACHGTGILYPIYPFSPWEACLRCSGRGWIAVSDGPDGREDPAASTKINYVPGEEKK
jgi:DnaJ-class molecular chaperone